MATVIYDALGGPLIDHVSKRDEPRDTGIDDVRSAVRDVGARETKHRYASELGDRAALLEHWDNRISEVGPYAAREAAQLYASAPRLPTPQDEQRDEGDHEKSVRAAYRAVAEKEKRQAQMPAALSALDRLQQRHGSLDVVDTFKRWDQQLQQNPYDAAPRVASEIAGRVNESIGMREAYQTRYDYEAKHAISDDERAVMQRTLQSGEMPGDMSLAHAHAKWELAHDIKDPHERAVVSANRQKEGPQIYFARLTVADWDQKHPDVSRGERQRMKQLLETNKATDLDDALRKVRRR